MAYSRSRRHGRKSATDGSVVFEPDQGSGTRRKHAPSSALASRGRLLRPLRGGDASPRARRRGGGQSRRETLTVKQGSPPVMRGATFAMLSASDRTEVTQMFGLSRLMHPAQNSESPDSDPQQILRFEADCVVRAIRFHLLDGKAAVAVSAESCVESSSRIGLRCPRLTIRRARWAAMTDSERLHWLLERSRTGIRFRPDGVAVLCSRP